MGQKNNETRIREMRQVSPYYSMQRRLIMTEN